MHNTFLLFLPLFSAFEINTREPILPDETVTVTIQNGTVKGRVIRNSNDEKIDRFLSIPFAQPPTGNLRFKNPEPASSWKPLTYNAAGPASTSISWLRDRMCLQQLITPVIYGTEDCLYLHLWRPNKFSDKLPVLIWIYGGAFELGSADGVTLFQQHWYHMDNLAGKGVICVGINYRLGPLGFLKVENSTINGNFGLYDQEMAINWVYENIEAFGGDKSKITVMGQSAGAASTAVQIRNPRLEGKISQGILLSGTHSAPWATNTENWAKQQADELLLKIGCDNEECLREADGKELVGAVLNVDLRDLLSRADTMGFTIKWAPVIDDVIHFDENNELAQKISDQKRIIIGHTDSDAYFTTSANMPRLWLNSSGFQLDPVDEKYWQI